jgi:hypothetical protein
MLNRIIIALSFATVLAAGSTAMAASRHEPVYRQTVPTSEQSAGVRLPNTDRPYGCESFYGKEPDYMAYQDQGLCQSDGGE